jgi:hypothetical protein
MDKKIKAKIKLTCQKNTPLKCFGLNGYWTIRKNIFSSNFKKRKSGFIFITAWLKKNNFKYSKLKFGLR